MDLACTIDHMLGDCPLCSGVNVESISTPEGYKHASDYRELRESALSCRLCALLLNCTHFFDSPIYLKLDRESGQEISTLNFTSGNAASGEKLLVYTVEGG